MNVQCPECRTEFDADSRLGGSSATCPACGQDVALPVPGEALDDFLTQVGNRTTQARTRSCPICGAQNPRSAVECRACGESLKPGSRVRDESVTTRMGLSLGSLAIVLIVGVLEFVLVIAAGVMEATTPGGLDETSPAAILIGLGILGGLFLDVVGIGLGIAALCMRGQNKLIAAIAVIIGVLILFGIGMLIAIGSAME